MPTLTSDPIHALIASDAWGTREILRACRTFSDEQFHRAFPIGPGSLHDTLTHIISVMRRWADRLAERPLRAVLNPDADVPDAARQLHKRSPQELEALLDDAEKDLLALAQSIRAANRLDSTVQVEWPGDPGTTKLYTFTRGLLLVHVTTHGYHHRAQCLNMLRHLNIPGLSNKLPEPSAVDWQAATEAPPIVRKQHSV